MKTASLRISNLKWLFGATTLLLSLFASTSRTDAKGSRLSGIDPEMTVNGQKLNVRVEWSTRHNCTVEETEVRFLVPKDSDHALTTESSELLPCVGGGFALIETQSNIEERYDYDMVSVKAEVKASRGFPVRVLVCLNGELTAECVGYANNEITCGMVLLDATPRLISSDSAFETGSEHNHEALYARD